uniref:General stress protein 17M-like domain-containing protein n=1 Tax=Rhizobium rhizogenes TaxID=359 RepID=A0A7S4ZUQ2_RHIRH|nr:hypothetical protein [Rhizobium rhizogenes]QCL10003.1 hypothetical protein pC5.8d_700 [Rhizobium rhizogenes]
MGIHVYGSAMVTYSNENSIVAVFDNLSDANDAADRLTSAGIPRRKLMLLSGVNAVAFAQEKETGFWNEIAAFFSDDDDRRSLLRELGDGGCLLVLADLDLNEDDIALDILDDD